MIQFLFVTLNNQRNNLKSKRNNMIVDFNEIEQLAKLTAEDKSNENKLEESISTMQDEIRSMKDTSSIDISSIVRIYVTFIAFILCLLIYVYYEILHPFKKLKDFAASIAKGDFDSPLYVERNNMFGEFTWSFDMMRNEVKKARRYEKEAVENNKIAIATISHDIKTPIASIRAYTEALQSNMDTSYERKQRYLSVILKKCDEVTELTNDLFLHFLSDLQKLEINCEKLDAKNTINDIINSLLSDKNKVVIHNEIPECIIYCDSKRIGQVFDNIIANSLKYGDDGTIDFYFKITKEGKYLECTIKDHGPGISDQEKKRGDNMKKVLIETTDLCRSYASDGLQNHVLNNINVKIMKDDFTVIMGSSGSGKSTLLYCLSGMDSITSGSVYFDGKEIGSMKSKELSLFRRSYVGFVFQQMHLVSNLSVFENIAVSGYLAKKLSNKEVNKKVDELLEVMGIKDLKKRLPSQISGGQKQRAAIARALINNPALVFADEPTGALNSKSGNEVLDLLTQCNRNGQSILMVTHDVKAAVRADRILYIEDGKIVSELEMSPYKEEDKKSRETQIISWLSSRGW